jgi:histidyl-tRNA synthetase
LVFKILKRAEKLESAASSGTELADLGLRFDLTVPLSRFYARHASELPIPFKAIQIGPVWRAERPQKGRYREFLQCDIDILGDDSLSAEVELILATDQCLKEIGLRDFYFRINDRRLVKALAQTSGIADSRFDAFCTSLDKFDKIGVEGVLADLVKGGFDPAGASRAVGLATAAVEQGWGFRGEGWFEPESEGTRALASLLRIRDEVAAASSHGVRVDFDSTLIRGMGYYTGTVIEIAHPAYKSSIGGGGRYDGMIGRFSGREVAACGLSIGIERLLDLLPSTLRRKRLVMFHEEGERDLALKLAQGRRLKGVDVLLAQRRKNFREQALRLHALGFGSYVLASAPEREIQFAEIHGEREVQ